MYLLKKIF